MGQIRVSILDMFVTWELLHKFAVAHHSLKESEMVLVIIRVSELRCRNNVCRAVQGHVRVAKDTLVCFDAEAVPGEFAEMGLEKLPGLDLVEGSEQQDPEDRILEVMRTLANYAVKNILRVSVQDAEHICERVLREIFVARPWVRETCEPSLLDRMAFADELVEHRQHFPIKSVDCSIGKHDFFGDPVSGRVVCNGVRKSRNDGATRSLEIQIDALRVSGPWSSHLLASCGGPALSSSPCA